MEVARARGVRLNLELSWRSSESENNMKPPRYMDKTRQTATVQAISGSPDALQNLGLVAFTRRF